MTDKVQKIREEVEKLKSNLIYGACSSQVAMETRCKEEAYNEILAILDFMQEEPVKIKKGCKYRSICNVTNKDTGNISFVAGKIYLAPKDNTLVSEENGWLCDTSEDASNFELVEEPVSSVWHDASEKPEREDLVIETNDGRIIHRQSINNYGMVKRWAYTSDLLNLDNSCNFGKDLQEESVSEDLEDEIQRYYVDWDEHPQYVQTARHFAKWQKKQDQSTVELAEDHAMLAGMEKMKEKMMANAIDVVVKVDAGNYPYIPQMELYDYDKDIPLAKEGDKVKIVVIKEEESV